MGMHKEKKAYWAQYAYCKYIWVVWSFGTSLFLSFHCQSSVETKAVILAEQATHADCMSAKLAIQCIYIPSSWSLESKQKECERATEMLCLKWVRREAQSFVKKVAKEKDKENLRCAQKQWFYSLAASTPERHSFWCKGYSNTCLKNGWIMNIKGVTV